MKPLSQYLKTIFTSGEQYTVIQLLNKLIQEVEKYEIETISIYRHLVTIKTEHGFVKFVSYSTGPTPCTTDTPSSVDWLIPQARSISYPCAGRYSITENEVTTDCFVGEFKYHSGLGNLGYRTVINGTMQSVTEPVTEITDIVTQTNGGNNNE